MDTLFAVAEKTIAITGGCGVLGGEMAAALVRRGANVVLLDRVETPPAELEQALQAGPGRFAFAQVNVLDQASLQEGLAAILRQFGMLDALINAAGGNHPDATTGPDKPFFDLPKEAMQFAVDLNILGTVLPCQVFGRQMATAGTGNIVNISSMNAFRPLTRIPAYSAAKAAVSNFTQWLAVHMAQEYSPEIRVNAIAPGFFLTSQNRYLLTEQGSGEPTERGRKIMAHTPMGRFGAPPDLVGTLLWLLSPASAFVTGIVVPVDGGFSAYSGV